uniref:Serpentine receptor class gamma n=1 Tax=Strongyloides stercoralis TaxID=6248 RepID=A0A913IBI8_STRER
MLSNSVTGILLKIYFGLCFIINVFSFFLYILILIFIGSGIKKKDKFYSSGFYKLIIFNGILDLIFIVEEYITFKIPQIGFFENFYINIFPKYLISGICYTYSIAQTIFSSLTGITITLNRFIAIKYPTKYNYIWSSWRLILLCTWPLLISVPVFIIFYKKELEYGLISNGSITVYYKDFYLNHLIWQILVIIHSIGLCINITLNVILIYTIKTSDILGKIKNIDKKKEMRLEISLARFAVVYCTFFTILVCVEIAIIISMKNEAYYVIENIFTSYAFIQSVVIFFTPYTLLYLSSDFRKKFLFFIGCSKLYYLGNKNKTSVKTIQTSTNALRRKITFLKN